MTWETMPEAVPKGKLAGSPEGTLVAIDGQRIVRSSNRGESWEEVHSYEVAEDQKKLGGHQGLRDVAFGPISR